jgi:alanine dehydrogenase
MVRVIPRQDHDGLLTYADGIEAVREAFVEYGEHPEYNETRHRLHTHDSGVRVSVHQALCPRLGGAGLMTHTEKPESTESQQKYEIKAHPVHVLHDSETGELLAIFVGELGAKEIPPTGVIAFRTTSTSAVGLDELAREDASDIGILGSGGQARNSIVAFNEVRDLETARVYSPTREHREAFAEEMPEYVDVNIEAVDGPEEVIAGADIVLAATDASSPVFDGDLLEPGQTVISIVGSNIQLVESGHAPSRRREVDDTTVDRADVIVANSVEQAQEYEQGDFYLPVQKGIVDWEDFVPLREVVVGNRPGRTSDEQIILYKNNVGEGITDVALATKTWEKVNEQDLGTHIDVFDPRE